MRKEFSVFFTTGRLKFKDIQEAKKFYLEFLLELLNEITTNPIYQIFTIKEDPFIVVYENDEMIVYDYFIDELDDLFVRKPKRNYITYASYKNLLDIEFLEKEIARIKKEIKEIK